MKNQVLKWWVYILIISPLLWMSCGSPSAKTKSTPTIVCTTGIIEDLVRHIGGDSFEVISLMGPGVDPHLYKATQGDLAKLRNADLIVYNGLHLEGKMGEVLNQLSKVQKVIAVANFVDSARLLSDPNYPDAYDPHIWFDVDLWASLIDGLALEMINLRPQLKSYIQNNATDYKKQLEELHDWVATSIQTIPEPQRKLITAHDAFKYFGQAYDIEVRGLQGISTVSEFGLKDRVDLVDFIISYKVPAVFLETSVSDRNINSVIETCRQKGHELKLGGSLYSDAMGAKDGPAGDYEGMVRSNVNTIVAALTKKDYEN